MVIRWTLMLLSLLVLGCSAEHPDPSGKVELEHDQNIETVDEVLPPKYHLGDTVVVSEDGSVGIIIKSYLKFVGESQTWIYQVMFQNKTIAYTEDKIILVEKFDWNYAKKGIVD